MKRFTLIIILSFIAGVIYSQTITTQGVLRVYDDQHGREKAVEDGSYTLTFRFYEVETGGSGVWFSDKTVDIVNGVFSVELGPFPNSFDFAKPYWMAIVKDNKEMEPRTRLSMSPYLFSEIGQSNVFPTAGNVGIGFSSPQEKLDVNGNIRFNGSHLIYNSQHGVIDWGENNTGNLYLRTLTNKGIIGDYTTRFLFTGAGHFGVGITDPNFVSDLVDVQGRSTEVFDFNAADKNISNIPGITIGNIGNYNGNAITNNGSRILFKNKTNYELKTYPAGAIAVYKSNSNNYNISRMTFFTNYQNSGVPNELVARMTLYEEGMALRGDLNFGPDIEYKATAGKEALKIIRGTVLSNGTRGEGSGFTVTRVNVGHYIITFDEAFSDLPTTTVTIRAVASTAWRNNVGCIHAENNNSIQILTNADGVTLTREDCDFNFIAIGPR
ncbi:MAG: hypothetical protein K9G44_08795 [Melioribacteraceae bacterium]|nr:hypothetical protein [Melioribacteraceae bacterium]